jgi:hypothetical protein
MLGFAEMWVEEALSMRTGWMLAGLVMMAVGAGARSAAAQTIDPISGMMVMPADPTADPGTYAMQLSQNAMLQSDIATANAQQFAQQSMAATQQAANDAMNALNAASTNDDSAAPAVAVVRLPVTPKPMIAPAGGKVVAGTQVTLSDADAKAVMFYTTDGTAPTLSSARYSGPLVVTAKEKVRAVAFDASAQPSGVMSKSFKLKG